MGTRRRPAIDADVYVIDADGRPTVRGTPAERTRFVAQVFGLDRGNSAGIVAQVDEALDRLAVRTAEPDWEGTAVDALDELASSGVADLLVALVGCLGRELPAEFYVDPWS